MAWRKIHAKQDEERDRRLGSLDELPKGSKRVGVLEKGVHQKNIVNYIIETIAIKTR